MARNHWTIDPTHSEVTFKVKHLMITNVTGNFKNFNLEVDTEDDNFLTAQEVLFTADVDSISTNNEQRDTHLKSPDFFDAESHKQIRFDSVKFEKKGADEALLYGDLTIRGVTKQIVLDVELAGIVTDPYGQTKAGFTVSGKVSRKDFGLTWGAVTEAGKVVVGDEIKVHCEIQLVKQAAVEAQAA